MKVFGALVNKGCIFGAKSLEMGVFSSTMALRNERRFWVSTVHLPKHTLSKPRESATVLCNITEGYLVALPFIPTSTRLPCEV